tara:strand:+ start:450 stop:617 length:168 start_codon:yes stop_codon:yes gene_type:complete
VFSYGVNLGWLAINNYVSPGRLGSSEKFQEVLRVYVLAHLILGRLVNLERDTRKT